MRVFAVAMAASLFAACSPPDTEVPGSYVVGAGVADAQWLHDRELDWARFETKAFHAYSPVNALASIARRRLDPSWSPAGVYHASDWPNAWQTIDTLSDGRDFVELLLLNVLFAADDPMFAPDLAPRIEQSLLTTKLWYTHPTPPGLHDDSYYWTENHQAIYRTIEYLLGRRYPDRAIGTDGRLGRDHAADARAALMRWMENRLRFGFSEWHSNVYYQKDLTPMLTLVEHADEPDVATRAAMVVDVLLVDLATHTLKDAFGVTHGRSYKKNKMSSTDEDTWDVTKMIFGASSYDYAGDDPGAAIFANTTKYDLPEVVRRIGADPGPSVVRERMSLPIQEAQPVDASIEEGAYGFRYDDPNDLPIWWGMGALTAWPVVPETIAELDKYDLWDNASLADAKAFRAIASSPGFAQNLSASANAMIDYALLRDVDTYTWRSPDVMLSSAIDFRKGTFNEAEHAWQATLDARAIVFTNHPFRPLATSGDWLDDPETGGYWNGEASAPRSAQIENVAIHVYAPQYARSNASPLDDFHWEPYTHAYFPQDYFDEVVQDGRWTFGRLGGGYVGLWSWRAPTYRVYDGVTMATGGRTKPFDLVADGGADDVWIVEVGGGGSFEEFRRALASAAITVTPLGPGKPTGESDGFDVLYDSPSQGRIAFGWNAPLVVNGTAVELHGAFRHESPYGRIPQDPIAYAWQLGSVGARHDIARGRRELFGP